jgi:hypothetical protein
MLQILTASNNIGLFLILMLWMLIVRLALWTLDVLFPRIERSIAQPRSERTEELGSLH